MCTYACSCQGMRVEGRGQLLRTDSLLPFCGSLKTTSRHQTGGKRTSNPHPSCRSYVLFLLGFIVFVTFTLFYINFSTDIDAMVPFIFVYNYIVISSLFICCGCFCYLFSSERYWGQIPDLEHLLLRYIYSHPCFEKPYLNPAITKH